MLWSKLLDGIGNNVPAEWFARRYCGCIRGYKESLFSYYCYDSGSYTGDAVAFNNYNDKAWASRAVVVVGERILI